jgi:hypothetical protein
MLWKISSFRVKGLLFLGSESLASFFSIYSLLEMAERKETIICEILKFQGINRIKAHHYVIN